MALHHEQNPRPTSPSQNHKARLIFVGLQCMRVQDAACLAEVRLSQPSVRLRESKRSKDMPKEMDWNNGVTESSSEHSATQAALDSPWNPPCQVGENSQRRNSNGYEGTDYWHDFMTQRVLVV